MSGISAFAARHLPGRFKLEQFHAHWAKDGSSGSEHTLNGKHLSGEVILVSRQKPNSKIFESRYVAQVHFVFYNEDYGTFESAMNENDGLAVIAVFIKVSWEEKPKIRMSHLRCGLIRR